MGEVISIERDIIRTPLGLTMEIQKEQSEKPIIGYRVWSVTRDMRHIVSMMDYRDFPWVPLKRFETSCNVLLRKAEAVAHEELPHEGCACGVYAFDSIESMIQNKYQLGVSSIIYGQVSLWGKVIQHEKGYRAQYAYPYSFYLLPQIKGLRPINIKEIAARYGVDSLEAPALLKAYVQVVNKSFEEKLEERRKKWPISRI